MARKKRKSSITRRLHRSFGAGAAIFILFMVVSGITINHSNDLGLDQRPVTQSALLNWYGLGGPKSINSFKAGRNWLSFAGSQLYLNGESVSAISSGVGAIAIGSNLIAAGSEELLLLDSNGQLVERIAWEHGTAGPIETIGLLPDGAIVIGSALQLWRSNSDLLSWQKTADTTGIIWSSPELAPDPVQYAIAQHYRGDKLNLERLLLDFHSGRIFGTIGVLVYDLLALAVGFLAISGMILWLRGRRNGKRR